MTHHQTRVAGVGPYQGKCACEARSEVVDHSWEADDWCRDHMDQVERARVHLYRQPSLASARDYYRRMASTATDPAHRDQWTMLADEIDLRLGNFPHDADAPLW